MSLHFGANSSRERAGLLFGGHRTQSVRGSKTPLLSWRAAHRFLEQVTARILLNFPGPEGAHDLALWGLKLGRHFPPLPDHPLLRTRAFGLNFPNPIGAAAGLDKHAQVVDGVLQRGFGFTEVGTITPKAQPGNPRPRVFRLRADQAIINRFGFNSEGHQRALIRLQSRAHQGGIVGVNIGANKDALDRVADYVAGITLFAPVASYFSVNISSPNTPGLRDLHEERAIDNLLARVLEARDCAAEHSEKRPVLLKIAPDLSLNTLDALVAISRRRRIDGIIVSNTTISRPDRLRDSAKVQEGGLSGRPLFELSTKALAETFTRVERAFPLIGVGGIDSGKAAWQKIRAGATLLQLYTALVYKGPVLLDEIKAELIKLLQLGGHHGIADVVGADAAALSQERG